MYTRRIDSSRYSELSQLNEIRRMEQNRRARLTAIALGIGSLVSVASYLVL